MSAWMTKLTVHGLAKALRSAANTSHRFEPVDSPSAFFFRHQPPEGFLGEVMPPTPWQLNVVLELVIGVTDVMLTVKD